MAADVTNLEGLPARVDSIEQKLDALSASVYRRFDEVSEHFVEQRQYTEFAFEKLRGEMLEGFARLEGRFDQLEGRFGRLERKFDQFVDNFNRTPQRRHSRRPPKKR